MIPLSIHACQKVKNDNYHLGQLNRPVSHINIQRIIIWLVFLSSHILYTARQRMNLARRERRD